MDILIAGASAELGRVLRGMLELEGYTLRLVKTWGETLATIALQCGYVVAL